MIVNGGDFGVQGVTSQSIASLSMLSGSATIFGNLSAGSLSGSANIGTANSINLSFGSDNSSTTYSGVITGNASLTKVGTGTFTLIGVNTYTGATSVGAGTLQAGAANAFASAGAYTVASGATMDLNGFSQTIGSLAGAGNVSLGAGTLTTGSDGTGTTFSGVMSGAGRLTKTGGGTFTLAGTNTYSGGTTVSAGTLQLSGAGTLGATSGATTVSGGTLDLNGTSQTQNGGVMLTAGTIQNGTLSSSGTFNLQGGTVSAALAGTGEASKSTSGLVTLTGANTYSGSTAVSAGTLLVNGSIASSSGLSVQAGATIGGDGTLPGTVIDGTLSPGNSPGTLTVAGDLTLNAGSTSLFELATPGVVGGTNDLVIVNGSLTLGGSLQTPGPPSGYYRLFDVAGATAGAFASAPAGATVITSVPNQVNLLLSNGGQVVQFWDGANLVGNGTVDGGTGIWNAANTNWTGAPGNANVNLPWISQVGVFTGSAGTVTVDGDISFQGLQFSTTGYTLTGGTLTMTGDPVGNPAASFVNVDGGVTTTIASTLAGTGGLEKLGGGTLTLTGANTYTGGTTIAAGTLQLGNGGTTGSILGDVADNGVLAFNRTDAVQFAGTISGSGAVQQLGAGTLMLSGANTYTGPTAVNGGILSVNGSIASSSLTTVDPGGTLGGNGTVGDTTIAGGTLAPGNSIGTLTVAGDLVFGAGSKYAVDVSPAAADRTNVAGTALLSGGTVVVTYLPGTFVAKDYTILNAAGGFAGTTFAGLDAASLPGLTTRLVYDPTDVHLVTAADETAPAFGALNRNQRAVAGTLLDYFDVNGVLPAEFAALNAEGLTVVSGELAAAGLTAGLDSADQFLKALDGQLETGAGLPVQGGAAAAYATTSTPNAPCSAMCSTRISTPTATPAGPRPATVSKRPLPRSRPMQPSRRPPITCPAIPRRRAAVPSPCTTTPTPPPPPGWNSARGWSMRWH